MRKIGAARWWTAARKTRRSAAAGAPLISESLYYDWSKEFREAVKRRLVWDTARQVTSSEVNDLRREARALKEVVAEQALELRLLKKA